MNKLYLLAILFLSVTFNSCVKVNDIPPTQLKVIVVDLNGNVVSGASVTLYETQSDYLNNTNPVVSGYTDANGDVYFTNLNPISYYYYIEYGSLTNDFTTFHFSTPLTPNQLNVYNPITIELPPPTQMKMQVFDNTGNPVSGASVTLYSTKTDFQNNTNPVGTTVTDANGYLFFSNLSPTVYYYYVQAGCLDNYNGNYYLLAALTPNVLNIPTSVTLSSVGNVNIVSNSFNPYKVLLDNVEVVSNLPAMSSITLYEVPAGYHTVEVIQLSGYTGLPNDEVFNNQSVKCGATTVVTFP